MPLNISMSSSWWWIGLRVIASHYLAALAGVGLRLDRDEVREPGSGWKAGLLLAALGFLIVFSPMPVRVGAVLILSAPFWAYIIVAMWDRIIEHRSYFAIAGVAFITGWAAEQTAMVYVLLALWAIHTVRRSLYFVSDLDFRRQAAIESPMKARARGQYGNALLAEGEPVMALTEYEYVFENGDAEERAIAERNIRNVKAVLSV